MLGPSCWSAAQERCEIALRSAGESAAAFGISRSMMYRGIGLSDGGFRVAGSAKGHGALSQLTRGFQLAYRPLGLFSHAQTCSAYRSKEFSRSFWPNSTG